VHSLDVSNIKRMEELVKQLLLSIEDAIDSKVAQKMEDVGANGYLLEKNVLSIDDVVMLTGLSKSHVYKLTSSRQLPFYKPNGKLMYFDKKEIEEWMRQNRIETVKEAEQNALRYIVKKGHKK